MFKFVVLQVDYYGGHRKMMARLAASKVMFNINSPVLCCLCCFKPVRLTKYVHSIMNPCSDDVMSCLLHYLKGTYCPDLCVVNNSIVFVPYSVDMPSVSHCPEKYSLFLTRSSKIYKSNFMKPYQFVDPIC